MTEKLLGGSPRACAVRVNLVEALGTEKRVTSGFHTAPAVDDHPDWLSKGGFLPDAWSPWSREAALREAAWKAQQNLLGTPE